MVLDLLKNGINMSGALQAVFQNQRSFGPPPPGAIGSAYEGGFYAGQIGVAGVATHYLVIAPRSSGQSASKQWKTTATTTSGTSSVIDGPTNSANMNDASHPAAQFCEGLSIGGFSDWYMPAQNELEVCYYNLKPTTTSNLTSSGTNTNAVPSRGSNYTAGTPAQTSADSFITGNSEALFPPSYWSSTENTTTLGWVQSSNSGNQYGNNKANASPYVRAVRRVAV